MAIESRRHNIPHQIASLKQQITTQQKEYKRYANLVEAQAAAPKILDDIGAQIAVLEKQLTAQEDVLANGNRSIAGERIRLQAQNHSVLKGTDRVDAARRLAHHFFCRIAEGDVYCSP